ncbi:MAG: GIY-YIG nuclease family protein [Alphaproteobacteria bacterium]
MTKRFFVYILTNRRNGTLYTGVSSDLVGRTYRHKEKVFGGFTRKYGIACLVYYEAHATAEAAITRERQIKAWKREWKINLIERFNPAWKDLYEEITK